MRPAHCTNDLRSAVPGPAGLSSESSLAAQVPSPWRRALAEELTRPSFVALQRFLDEEQRRGAHVFPARSEVFAALRHTPPSKVKLVLLGQDPYPTAGNANGLAFSVSKGVAPLPGSLRNLFKGLQADVGIAPPPDGDLTPWTRRGVLLLNTVLTVREGEPNSHRKKGWEEFTEAVLRTVNQQSGTVVFLCLGLQAQAMAGRLVDGTRHPILSAPHPSPLTGNRFLQAAERERPFSRANGILLAAGRGAIDWSLG